MKKELLPLRQETGTNNIVTGIRVALLRICININILFLAFTCLKNPFQGIKIMKGVQRKRKSVQGLTKIKKFIKGGRRYFFSENIPGWPSSAFNGFFRAEISRTSNHNKKVPLSTIIFAITTKCRLGCKHCYEWDNIAHKDKLSPDDLKYIIKKIKEYGAYHIQLSGGEPLERFDDLVDLLLFTGKSVDLWLLTSGFGLTYEKALALKKAGLTGANISLDHWAEKEHNRSRNNPKSFFWAKEAVRNCRMAGILTTLSLCAFRSFVSHQNLMKYANLSKEWGVGFIRLLEPRAAGRYKGKDIALGKEQIELLEEFYQVADSSEKFIDYPIVTYPGYHQRRIGCLGAGNRYLYIDSVGDIHACPFCQRSAGNAVSDRFEDAVSVLRVNGCQEYAMSLTD
jgi:MoaA/NifB/PqqE/SkfB family radical SAM enzyme